MPQTQIHHTREVTCLNTGWKFHPGDIELRNFNGVTGEELPAAEWLKAGNMGPARIGYPDADWRSVNLPHDFVVEGDFSPQAKPSHGSLPAGVGWYRKTFFLPEDDEGRCIFLEFDGVYRDCSVWLNGHFIGRHLSGYTSFSFEISEVCHYGEMNALAVRVDASQFELWSYEGGGIYREVRLVKTQPLHVATWGTFVRAVPPDDPGGSATLSIETDLVNVLDCPADCEVLYEVFSPTGDLAAVARWSGEAQPETTDRISQAAGILQPSLWDIDSPNLYTLRTTVFQEGRPVDEVETTFGIRSIRFTPQEGFFLNGRNLKLKGVCCHQDHAGVGIAVPPALQAWRVKTLKEMGANALRTSHNPPDPALLDACDRLGLLVMDENRILGVSEEVLGQLTSLIQRDRNHPSVILWSLGNEEMHVQHTRVGVRIFQRMQALAHKLDPTRPVTYAMNNNWYDIADLYNQSGFHMDVWGGNYVYEKMYDVDGHFYDRFHAKYPDWNLVATESGGFLSTRGLYEPEKTDPPMQFNPGICWTNPARKEIVSGYGETCTPWGYSLEQTWKDCANRPFLAGTFLWTGFDYRGEINPCSYPAVITRFGVLDLCGFPKDLAFYLRAWWRAELLVYIFPHWNWAGREGQIIDIWCFSNCAKVDLLLNGTSLGMQEMQVNSHLEWHVPYQPGRLEARGYDREGSLLETAVRETTGAPAQLQLSPDRLSLAADGEDVVVVNVAVQDAQGRLVPTGDNLVRFEVSGPASILGVGNGNPTSHEADKADRRKAYMGLCQVLLQSTAEPGRVVLRAVSEGLEPAEVVIIAKGS